MAQHILLFLTRCSAWLTVQLMVHSQTTPPHNMLLYLIWLFNYKPLANCKSSGSWLEPQLRVFSAKASSKASSRGFPSRAACGAWDTPEPSSRRFPALTDASLCWCRLRWWWGRAWSVGQRFRALTFLSLSLSRHVSPPHAPLARTESSSNRRPRSVAEAHLILTPQHLSKLIGSEA